jgi:HPr kinase/phosphorylase
MRSQLKTSEFYRRLKPFLEEEFAATTTLHGSLADVYGVGLLFIGQSGIGKSECVLDLVERGHRLVADDLVIASRRGSDIIIGRGHELQRHHMEIRGVGVIDVPAIFGVRAVRQQKRIEVVVQLEEWNRAAQIDRTGLDTQNTSILGVEIPKVTVPLNPGKNITVVAEVVAMNHLLRYAGVDVAEAFNERLIGRMQTAILFTDLGSGSCGFVCRSIGRVEADVAVVTGVNLPMLLDFVFHRDLPSVELAFRVAEKGRTDARAFPHEPERDVSGSVPD